MSWRTLLKIVFAIAAPLGVYPTLLLIREYVLACSGRQEPEWQIAFEIAPLPMLLGVLSLGAALIAKPRFPAVLVAVGAGIVAIPALLFLLVMFHVY